jgi:outer membrane cobalamin receptor
VGATVYLKELKTGTITGLDGSYIIRNITPGTYTVFCSYISYQSVEKAINIDNPKKSLNFILTPSVAEIEQVTVTATNDRSTENNARASERLSLNTINVVSARAIELSPDLNVANVVQRMSGVILEKNSSNSGSYAILRGMDKRYNYTLVNGIKIPSTNNKHRYVSLDMFPSDLIDRIEVTKTLTPDMEGDAIAGAINIIMKNAPDRLMVMANASTGYNMFCNEYDFKSFHTSDINKQSPYEINGSGYYAKSSDFPKTNIDPYNINLPLDYQANLTLGNRFLDKKLGVVVAGSYSGFHLGKRNSIFGYSTTKDGYNMPQLSSEQERIYTEEEKNFGIHSKIDYRLNNKHRIELYTFYVGTLAKQVREVDDLDLDLNYLPQYGTYQQNHSTRTRLNQRDLFSSNLEGCHLLSENIEAQWNLVYSIAKNRTPDQVTIEYNTDYNGSKLLPSYIDFDGSERLWRHNLVRDLAAYFNLKYKADDLWGTKTTFKVGGLYRKEDRESFKTSYTLLAISSIKPADSVYYSEKGVDWNQYSDINWKVYNPRAATANGETFDAHENVIHGYAMFQSGFGNWYLTGGLRVEYTEQGYYMQFPIGQTHPDGKQTYFDFLPSINLKYEFREKHNFRLSYFRATNKPGFMEIVPCPVVDEDYTTQGTYNLNRATADNIDLRWEFFPTAVDQIMVGLFYKDLHDPIEYAFTTINSSSQKITYSPINNDQATNKGIEIDVIKYFRMFGVKANYTYTHSSVTTTKLSYERDENGDIFPNYNVKQTRPLYGQAEHVGNISLLYKGVKNGFNGQLSFSYVGDRLYTVSQIVDNDLWQKGTLQMSASAEKSFKNGLAVFAKAQNLLTPTSDIYIKKVNTENEIYPMHSIDDDNTLIRREEIFRSFLVGIRYRLNK